MILSGWLTPVQKHYKEGNIKTQEEVLQRWTITKSKVLSK